MKNLIIISSVLILLISALSCDFKEGKIKSAEVKPVVCVIAIDGTHSYQYLDRAKQTAGGLLVTMKIEPKITMVA